MSGQPPMTGTLLPLQLAGVSYVADGKRLVDEVTLAIAATSRTVILGPNGAGKSLLLKLCHGLLRPTSGTIRFSGPERTGSRKRHAMVFQRPMTLRRSVLANVTYGLALAGMPRERRREKALETLERVGLAARRLARRPGNSCDGRRTACRRDLGPRPQPFLHRHRRLSVRFPQLAGDDRPLEREQPELAAAGLVTQVRRPFAARQFAVRHRAHPPGGSGEQ